MVQHPCYDMWSVSAAWCGHRAQEQHEFSVHWVPRRTIVCDRVLAEEGVAGDVVAEDYPLVWVPLDSDLLSLELPSAFQANPLCRYEMPVTAAAPLMIILSRPQHCICGACQRKVKIL